MAQAGTVWDRFEKAAALPTERRAAFIQRTYLHLLGAILAFVVLEMFLIQSGLAQTIAAPILRGGGAAWLLVLGGFMLVGWFATRLVDRAKTPVGQYLGLALYVAIEGLIFVPLLLYANIAAPGAIATAAVITVLGFTALTAIVMFTRKDFSFLRGALLWGGVLALGLIVAGVAFGFNLGLWFSFAMVAFAGAAVLYNTSAVLLHETEDRHVAASLQLFAAIALMFWYVLRIVIALQDD